MRKLHELYKGPVAGGKAGAVWDAEAAETSRVLEQWFMIPGFRSYMDRMLRINILAMGDVGGTLALAMKLTGGDIVSEIGICDISEKMLQRWEQELNQIALPSDPDRFPLVRPVALEDLFDCDVFVFCASRGVPDVSQKDIDVRMVQLEKNLELVRSYARQAVDGGYEGEFFVVSDPVDPLCKGALLEGIDPNRIQGFGLGVMNGRAAYYARQSEDPAAKAYLTEGRVFGPHGEDLVVANSVVNYDDESSVELTRLTTTANLKIRDLGFKPYIAPAVTSGALSILENLRGNWQYSSAWFGENEGAGAEAGAAGAGTASGAFLGMRNCRIADGLLVEDYPLDDRLFARIEKAYRNLERIV